MHLLEKRKKKSSGCFRGQEKMPGRLIAADPWRSLFIFFAIYVWNVLWMKGIIWQFTADFLQKVGKWMFQRSGSPGKKMGLESIQRVFFFCFFFCFALRIPPGNYGWVLWVKTKGKRREAAKKEGTQRQGFLPEEFWGEDTFPVSQLSLWWPKIAASDACDSSSVFITSGIFPLESLLAIFGKQEWQMRGRKNRSNSAEMKVFMFCQGKAPLL